MYPFLSGGVPQKYAFVGPGIKFGAVLGMDKHDTTKHFWGQRIYERAIWISCEEDLDRGRIVKDLGGHSVNKISGS